MNVPKGGKKVFHFDSNLQKIQNATSKYFLSQCLALLAALNLLLMHFICILRHRYVRFKSTLKHTLQDNFLEMKEVF